MWIGMVGLTQTGRGQVQAFGECACAFYGTRSDAGRRASVLCQHATVSVTSCFIACYGKKERTGDGRLWFFCSGQRRSIVRKDSDLHWLKKRTVSGAATSHRRAIIDTTTAHSRRTRFNTVVAPTFARLRHALGKIVDFLPMVNTVNE